MLSGATDDPCALNLDRLESTSKVTEGHRRAWLEGLAGVLGEMSERSADAGPKKVVYELFKTCARLSIPDRWMMMMMTTSVCSWLADPDSLVSRDPNVADVGAHVAFLGPPGTGKTTFAGLLERLLFYMGRLPLALAKPGDTLHAARRPYVRADLVAPYEGRRSSR